MERFEFAEPSFWEFRGKAAYTDAMFLMATPFPIAAILIAYLWFVLKFGPEFMKNKKPYHLGSLLVAYNVVQVALSTFLFMKGVHFISNFGLWSQTCHCEKKENTMILDASHLYFSAKVIELLDTVLFVLRKKQNQVSFLHVYHHTLMVISTWLVVKYNKTDATIFIGTINSLVHIVMYAYYALSVFPALTKFLWWKKYITIMQLVQFTMMFTHIIVSHMVSDCKPAYALLLAVCVNTVLFMYLFGDFYVKSYTKSKSERENVKSGKIGLNDLSHSENGLNALSHRRIAATA